jgi:hypothetical protein
MRPTRLAVQHWLLISTCVVVSCAAAQASTPCAIPTTVGVVICAPTNEATVPSPVEISAAGKGNAQLKAWKIYVDGTGVWTSPLYVNSIDPSLTITAGQHRVTVKAWDVNGVTYSQTIYITVPCTATVDRTVVICSISATYVHFSTRAGWVYVVSAVAKDQRPLGAMKLYLNGVHGCTVYAATLAANGNRLYCQATGPGGSTRVTVTAWDALGSFSTTKYFLAQ